MEIIKLLEPITINGLVIPNRTVMPSMGLAYTSDYTLTDRFKAFYRERAEGGVGLMTIGPIAIDKAGSAPFMPALFDDQYVEPLKNYIDELHRDTDTKVANQLIHLGRAALLDDIGCSVDRPLARAEQTERGDPSGDDPGRHRRGPGSLRPGGKTIQGGGLRLRGGPGLYRVPDQPVSFPCDQQADRRVRRVDREQDALRSRGDHPGQGGAWEGLSARDPDRRKRLHGGWTHERGVGDLCGRSGEGRCGRHQRDGRVARNPRSPAQHGRASGHLRLSRRGDQGKGGRPGLRLEPARRPVCGREGPSVRGLRHGLLGTAADRGSGASEEGQGGKVRRDRALHCMQSGLLRLHLRRFRRLLYPESPGREGSWRSTSARPRNRSG